MVKIRENVPASAKVEIKVLKTLDEVWEFLDAEYGDPERLTAQRVKDLHSFRYSGKAKTDRAKVRELHQIWREVYTDLEVVDAVENLDNAHCIQGFISKFPVDLQKDFVRFEAETGNSARKKSDLMNAFLLAAKKEVQLLDRFSTPAESSAGNSGAASKGSCSYCGKAGHLEEKCYTKDPSKTCC